MNINLICLNIDEKQIHYDMIDYQNRQMYVTTIIENHLLQLNIEILYKNKMHIDLFNYIKQF